MFNKPNPKQNFYELEDAILKWWKQEEILNKSIEQRDVEKSKTFYDGPITANGEPHTGHMLTFSLKDVVPRFWTMKGYQVQRSLGWDCHGIPVEYEIEKKLGFKEKKDIEKYGIAEFNKLCRESVEKYKTNIIELEEKVGRLTNDTEEYATMDKDFIESVWWSLKELYNKGMLYEGFKVVPYSTRAGTTLSNAEVALGGYKPFVDPAVTVEFPLKDDKSTILLAWTTTPWTMPSNLGLAVGKKIKYSKVKTQKLNIELKKVWLVKDLPTDLKKAKTADITQAFIDNYTDGSGKKIHSAQVRKVGDKYTFTVKYFTDNENGQLIEVSKEITKEEYVEKIKTATKKVVKTRYSYPLENGLTAEIYIYKNNLEGLKVVEVEYPTLKKEQSFTNPEWFGKEVTSSEGVVSSLMADKTIDEVNKLNESHTQSPQNYENEAADVTYVVASELVEKVFKGKDYEIVGELTADDLVGKEYIPPFDFFTGRTNAHKIYEGFHVTTDSGTGIVHLAPYGVEDNEIFQKVGIESFDVLDEQGDFNDMVPRYNGLNYRDANPIIIQDLKAKSRLFAHEEYEHEMPMCWRTKTPLIYKPITSWFVAMSTIRKELVENNNKINWVPAHAREGRFGNWLSEIKDWGISRKRYWGTPLPVWKSESGKTILIGSYAELKELSGVEIEDPHRPYIDDVKFEKDGEVYTRITDVIDVWYDSGAMPFARLHYPFENKDKFAKKFPAEYIAEGIDQTRGWFYSLHAIGTALMGSNAFQNVVINGTIVDAQKRKLSKSLGNYSPPLPTIEKFGADTVRLNFFATPLMYGEDTTIDDKTLMETKGEMILPLWNIFSYLVTYANLNNWQPREELAYNLRNVTGDEHPWDHIPFDNIDNNLDAWMILKLQKAIESVTESMESYNMPNAIRAIKDLINEISKWFIRSSRDRFADGDLRAIEVLYYVTVETAKLLAPFAPFISEHIYKELVVNDLDNQKESIHLCDFPEVDKSFVEEYARLEAEMDLIRTICEYGHSLRVENKLKVRQPLNELQLHIENEKLPSLTDWMRDIIKNELNVKEVNEKLTIGNNFATKEDTNLKLKVALDIEVTESLKKEGLLREIVRNVQSLRKENKLNVHDKIELMYASDNVEVKNVFNDLKNEISESVKAVSITETNDTASMAVVKVNDSDVYLKVTAVA